METQGGASGTWSHADLTEALQKNSRLEAADLEELFGQV